jgi:Tfp pilus assembly protein PilF
MRPIFLMLLIVVGFNCFAQSDATFSEYNKTFTTYPFSNPDPVPDPSSISYPYFRYDGFTDNAVQKEWKVVELQNDFIKLIVLPQVGGKIWTAIDKKNGKPFIYDNDAIKFRDIAMRGPWTSGGLEANFGIIGHTPGVATPVNYLTRKNADGSVSCIISLLDLLTQTRWDMEINLPKDKAYFITRFFWHNGTSLPQPYYSWMNLGQKVSDSLEYIFPGNHYIFHDGKLYDFPINPENQKTISIYDQNNFGGYKSYHVTGAYSKYFGVLWQKENFGMIHYAERQDKIGKKIWIWGLSRQGMIWEKLLTDHSGQYTEIQSGRLYNQNAPESVSSPFKQFDFAPYNTDTWSEYWYPFQNTDGVAKADLNGVFNIKTVNGEKVIFISPVSYINDTLKVWDTNEKLILNMPVNLQPLQSFQQNISLSDGESVAKITLAGSVIELNDSVAKVLDRPLEPFKNFDWNTAYGFYLKGNYDAGTRHYREAENNIRLSISKEPGFIPSLDEMAFLQYRKMNYDSAYYFARSALNVNTYDPAANYYYGLATLQLNKIYDAEDGFEVAAITSQYRSAAYTELSKIKLQQKNYKLAFEYAEKSLVNNSENITSLELEYVCSRLMGNSSEKEKIKVRILHLDPMNHFIRFEDYWQNKNIVNKDLFTFLIRDELPQQTYLNLAVWYSNLGLTDESKALLEACPQKDDEILYWLAWLHRNDKDAEEYLKEATNGNAYLVFPFRSESVAVMNWASEKNPEWKSRYYLSLIDAFHDQEAKALQLMEEGTAPENFAPYFVLRARLRDSADVQNIQTDLSKAQQIDKNDWRYSKYLAEFLLSQKKYNDALETIEPYYKKDNTNYMAGLLYIQCLVMNKNYEAAEKTFDIIKILPYEGAQSAHNYYEQTKLNLALQYLKAGNYKLALQKVNEASLWPESVGAGAPYPDMINNSLEDGIQKLISETKNGQKLSTQALGIYQAKVMAITNKGK